MSSDECGEEYIMRKREKAALFLLIMILTGLIAFLAGITVYSSDDYWYSTFMNGGIAEYFRMMKEHYLTCNGRNLVHFFAQLILHFGNGLFAVFAVGIFLLIPLSADRIRGIGCSGDTGDVVYGGKEKYGSANGEKTKDTNGRPELFMILIFFAAGILLLPLPVMVNGVLWISGFRQLCTSGRNGGGRDIDSEGLCSAADAPFFFVGFGRLSFYFSLRCYDRTGGKRQRPDLFFLPDSMFCVESQARSGVSCSCTFRNSGTGHSVSFACYQKQSSGGSSRTDGEHAAAYYRPGG